VAGVITLQRSSLFELIGVVKDGFELVSKACDRLNINRITVVHGPVLV